MENTIAVLGGDRRMVLLAQLLHEDGFTVHTHWLVVAEDSPLEEVLRAERVLLPTPLARGERLNCRTEDAPTLSELFAQLTPAQRLYAGGVKPSERALAQEHSLILTDYLAREETAVRNAVPTAEGALALAMAETETTLCGTECLVLGFGRIGKLLAHRLRGLGASVSVSARRMDDLAWIDAFGYRGLHTNRLAGRLGDFRVIFNTVPHLVLDASLLGELRQDCVLIELASSAGFDRAAAETLGHKCIAGGGLPGKVAPETAARVIRAALRKLWEEEA